MAHEDLRREHVIERSSDRAFALVFVAAFVLICGWPLLHGASPRWWAGALAAVLAVIGLVKPGLLAGANRAWSALGVALGHIVAPAVLAVLFYAVLTPVGMLMRLTGNDSMRLKRERDAASYWIARKPPGPPADSMKNQF
jgi:hypothetical protein